MVSPQVRATRQRHRANLRSPSGAASSRPDRGAGGRGWQVVRDVAPLVTVVAAILYGVLRLAFALFYLHLRATPEEVGYGYVEILAGQMVGLVEFLVVFFALIFVIGLVADLGRGQFARLGHRHDGHESAGARPTLSGSGLTRLSRRSALIALLVVPPLLLAVAWWFGVQAANGTAVRSVYFAGIPEVPVLAVQAEPADVAWTPGHGEGGLDVAAYRCLLYLGKDGNTSVFYDVASQDGLRLPTADISVRMHNRVSVPIGC
jgi:hypothetical protein